MKTSLAIAFILVVLVAYSQEEMKQDSSVTAIDNEIAFSISVYPNPFRENLTFKTAADLNGKRIDLNAAPAGLYFIVFSNRRTKFIQKIRKDI